MNPFIKLEKICRSDKKLEYKFSSSLNFLKKNSFFIEYPNSSELSASESLNSIPFAAVMVPISWATGADVIIPCLDETYISSLEDCSEYFKGWFRGKWPFEGRLLTQPVKNEYAANRSGLLFSGGLDSLTTYIHQKRNMSVLFTLFGMDIPLKNIDFIEKCKKRYEEFAKQQGVEIRWIQSDVREMYGDKDVSPYCRNWYNEAAHGLILTSFTAPLSAVAEIGQLFFASSQKGPHSYPWGSDVNLDSKIKWGQTKVVHDNGDIGRIQKIERYFKNEEVIHKYLRVCCVQYQSFNCGQCEKCLRTICGLLAQGIDPSRCNFKMDETTLPRLRAIISQAHRRYNFFSGGETCLDFWREIQASVADERQILDLFGARDFFRWFLKFETLDKRQNRIFRQVVAYLARIKACGKKLINPRQLK